MDTHFALYFFFILVLYEPLRGYSFSFLWCLEREWEREWGFVFGVRGMGEGGDIPGMEWEWSIGDGVSF